MLFAAAFVLTACAAGKATFHKAGISPSNQERESAQCWKEAQIAREPEHLTAARTVGSLIGGGVIGLAGVMVSSAMAESDPENIHRRSAHYDCMKRKGYAVPGDFKPVDYTTKPKTEYEQDEQGMPVAKKNQ